MNNQFVQLFFYLAGLYIIDGVVISYTRRLKISDFVGHILTGVIFGILLKHSSTLLNREIFTSLSQNNFIFYLAQLGILVFFMQLGFNFSPKMFTTGNKKKLLLYTSLLVLISTLVLGIVGYGYLFHKEGRSTFYFVIAFLGINIGALLSRNFPVPTGFKRTFTTIVQMALLVDLLVIFIFSFVQWYHTYLPMNPHDWLIETLSWLLLTGFFALLFFPKALDISSRFLYQWLGEFAMLLKLGVFFLFIYAGLKVGLSIMLIGLWSGFLFRYLAASTQFEAQQKFFPIASYLYLIPFVEIGRFLVYQWDASPFFWQQLIFTLLGVAGIAIFYSMVMSAFKEKAMIFGLGVLPRGELSVLILWLLLTPTITGTMVLPTSMIVVGILAVMITSLIGTVLGIVLFTESADSTVI
ncbi:MAG: hypothetical protein D6748_02325 [Calditrichaeota bacterium]|nr:MAG: hypothetical protein D6748_02325 [Calditrichota bacterium]